MVSALDSGAVRVQALAGDIVLHSWARHFTLTVPLSTQVYKWVPVNLILWGNPAMDQHPIQEGVKILLVAPCHRNRDKLRPGGPHWPVCRLCLLPRQERCDFHHGTTLSIKSATGSWGCGSLLVNVLNSGSISLGSSSGQGHYVVYCAVPENIHTHSKEG